jgi:tight adherence protein B
VIVAAAALVLTAAPAAVAGIQVTPVERVVFPKRQFVLDIQRDARLSAGAVSVRENDAPVGKIKLQPFLSSAVRSSVVLAIDASKSMAGDPYEAALAAARNFASNRAGRERIGVVTFNSGVQVVQKPTASAAALAAALKTDPPLGKGTHIYDAVVQSVALLDASASATAAIVLLSDGTDIGSIESLESAIETARREHVRVFTIGLASETYDPAPLRDLAEQTGASYFEAASSVDLGHIYSAIGDRLANQYLLEYRSQAIPNSSVTVNVQIAGLGTATLDYRAPDESAIAPFHRSFFERFVTSPAATIVISLLVAGVVCLLLVLFLRRRPTGLTGRVEDFLAGMRPSSARLKATHENVRASVGSSSHPWEWLRNLERDLEIADADVSATRVVAVAAGVTAGLSFVFLLVSPAFVVLTLVLVPLAARGWVRRKRRKVEDEFSDQLPSNLQVLASAMRAGYSLNGALAVAVDNAHEPSRRELRRAVNDEKLGVPIDEALRRVADRMRNRDLHQVALLSELQRSAGGNAAEVLDTVVDTIRERTDVRLLVRTLTAQGRMARWILTAMPAVIALLLWLMQPAVMNAFFRSTGGQIALLLAAIMTAAGSIVIQRMVDIEV